MSVHSRANHFPPLPVQEPAYRIEYSQPRLNHVEPHNVIWEKKTEHIRASDDTEALRKMCEFLGSGMLRLNTHTYPREGIKLIAEHPYRVVSEYPYRKDRIRG